MSKETKRILVTGGAGFIGSHVAEAYIARGDEVWVVDNLYGRLALAALGATAMVMLSRVPVLEAVAGDQPGT